MSYPDSLPFNGADEESDKKDQELIVVASLLDKAPNLAGLSRTCEVPSTGLKSPLCCNALTCAEKSFSLDRSLLHQAYHGSSRDVAPTNQLCAYSMGLCSTCQGQKTTACL